MKMTSMNEVPIIAVSTVMMAVLAAAKVRSRKRRRSNSGEGACSSHQAQTTSRSTAPAMRPSTAAEDHPQSLPWMIASVRQKRPAVTRPTPGQSSRAWACRSRWPRTSTSARATPRAPTGRLNQKTAGQPQRWMSTPPSTGPAAAAAGPVLGGVLIQRWGWPAVFWFNLPVGALGVALALVLVRGQRERQAHARLDWPGVGLVTAGLFCLTLAIIQGNDWGWSSAAVLGLIAGAVLLLVVWAWWELHAPSPLFDLRLFRDRTFAAASTAIMTVDTAMMGTMFMLVIFMIAMMDYSELRAGLAIATLPAAVMVFTPPAGWLTDRIGPR